MRESKIWATGRYLLLLIVAMIFVFQNAFFAQMLYQKLRNQFFLLVVRAGCPKWAENKSPSVCDLCK